MTYKEIKTSFAPDTADKPVESVEVFIDEGQEENMEAAPVVQETPKEDEAAERAKAEKRKSRAQARIKGLLTEKSDLEARLEAERKEKEELRKQLQMGQKTTKETMKGTLESHIASLTRQLTEAIKQGEAEMVVQLQDELMNAKISLQNLNQELKAQYVEAESPKPDSQNSQQVALPQAALDWIEDHPAFKTDHVFHYATIGVNNQLLSEGWNPQTDEFYDELSTRLAKRFPEQFGIESKNSVQWSQDKQDLSPPSTDVKAESQETSLKPEKARTIEQTVSGSSRPSANTIQPRTNSNSVTLGPAEIAQAERWGLSLEQMARRIAHQQKNKRTDGYVPIKIETNKA